MVLKNLFTWTHKLFLAFSFLLLAFDAFSQQATISGTITDSTGKALEGASVSVFGMPLASVTDANGNY